MSKKLYLKIFGVVIWLFILWTLLMAPILAPFVKETGRGPSYWECWKMLLNIK